MAPSNSSDLLPSRALETLRANGLELQGIEALPGDVSLRRYFRVRLEGYETAILATYPAALGTACERFSRSTALLAARGVPVPAIYRSFCDAGLMLLEDLGERTLYDLRMLTWRDLTPYLRNAIELIPAIADIPSGPVGDLNPPLDEKLLKAELERTWNLLTGEDGVVPDPPPEPLARALDEMIERLAGSEQRPSHRDFMARNLVPVGDSAKLAVIDHQDLRLGPKAYDLASLLNDSLFPPAALEEELVSALLDTPGERLDYDRAASQRTLKAVGTFVAFSRRGDSRHRALIRPSLERARAHLHRLPEMTALGREIDLVFERLLTAPATGEPAD